MSGGTRVGDEWSLDTVKTKIMDRLGSCSLSGAACAPLRNNDRVTGRLLTPLLPPAFNYFINGHVALGGGVPPLKKAYYLFIGIINVFVAFV